MAVLGVDVGTSSVKVGCFATHPKPEAAPSRFVAERELVLRTPHPGHQVQDPAEVAAALAEAIAACAGAAARDGVPIEAVALSTAMHGLIGLDADRRPITPLVTWADGRAADQARRLRADGAARELHRATGTPVHPMSPLVKLVWFADEEPDLTRCARWWIGLDSWVLLTLTGELATQPSSASGTGLFDPLTGGWSPRALAVAGLTEDQLPPIRPSTDAVPLAEGVARRTGLPPGLPVILGGADGPLATLGVGATRPGTAALSIGTSAALRACVARPTVDAAGTLFCYALLPGVWVLGGAVSNGGSVVPWAREVFGVRQAQDDAALLAAAEAVPAGSDGLIALPYLLPERAPLWDPDLPGAFLGVRRDHGPAHFVRAIVEGVAAQLHPVLRGLEEVTAVEEIRATGGAFRSGLWRTVVAGVLGRPLTVLSAAEGTALGAAAVGLVAIGGAVSAEDAVRLLQAEQEHADVVRPDPEIGRVWADQRDRLPDLLGALGAAAAALGGRAPQQ